MSPQGHASLLTWVLDTDRGCRAQLLCQPRRADLSLSSNCRSPPSPLQCSACPASHPTDPRLDTVLEQNEGPSVLNRITDSKSTLSHIHPMITCFSLFRHLLPTSHFPGWPRCSAIPQPGYMGLAGRAAGRNPSNPSYVVFSSLPAAGQVPAGMKVLGHGSWRLLISPAG